MALKNWLGRLSEVCGCCAVFWLPMIIKRQPWAYAGWFLRNSDKHLFSVELSSNYGSNKKNNMSESSNEFCLCSLKNLRFTLWFCSGSTFQCSARGGRGHGQGKPTPLKIVTAFVQWTTSKTVAFYRLFNHNFLIVLPGSLARCVTLHANDPKYKSTVVVTQKRNSFLCDHHLMKPVEIMTVESYSISLALNNKQSIGGRTAWYMCSFEKWFFDSSDLHASSNARKASFSERIYSR